MAPSIIPYGQLADGKYGVLLENGTRKPLASALEILTTLPSVADPDNFEGRLVYSTTDATVFVYTLTPAASWISLEGVPADVGAVAGSPPTVPTPATGSLFWDTDTEVMFVWDSGAWQGIGGRYAAQIIQNSYLGDGVTTSFPTGAAVGIASSYVEVFQDGVRQKPNPGGDYDVVGTNVVFGVAVPNGVNVLVRALVSDVLAQNAQVTQATFVATVGQTQFNTGVAGSDPAGIFVFVDGAVQTSGVDYQVNQQDTRISAISKISSTVARVTTIAAHGLSAGGLITIGGALQSAYNASFTISSIFSTTQFDIPVLSGDPASATPDPVLYFTPPSQNDTVVFTAPLAGGENVDIRSLKSLIVAPSAGEANTLTSVGAGVGLHAGKVGVALQLKSLIAGANIAIIDNGNDVTISSSSGASFEDRVGINTFAYLVSGSESYVGVRSTTNPVSIDLSGIAVNPSNSGRTITIQDESGGAGTNNITISTGGPLIDGGPGSYVISTNYGAVTLIMDGNNWFIRAEKT